MINPCRPLIEFLKAAILSPIIFTEIRHQYYYGRLVLFANTSNEAIEFCTSQGMTSAEPLYSIYYEDLMRKEILDYCFTITLGDTVIEVLLSKYSLEDFNSFLETDYE